MEGCALGRRCEFGERGCAGECVGSINDGSDPWEATADDDDAGSCVPKSS